MFLARCIRPVCISLFLVAFAAESAFGAAFRVATYNLENYVEQATGTRAAKSPESKAKVRESILSLKPDVIALEEMGSAAALKELQLGLKEGGLNLPFSEHVQGFATNVHVAVLSRFPIVESRPRTNENYLLSGRRFRVSRGFAEVDIRVSPNYTFTLLAAHLKSKRIVAEADEAEMRLEEGKLLRERIDALLSANPALKLVVAGDFNDTKDSAVVKTVMGRGRARLIDTRPAERNGDTGETMRAGWEPRNITWTHYYGTEDTYSRIDYLLVSPVMNRDLVRQETFVLAVPDWGLGSDHRPIVATFEAAE